MARFNINTRIITRHAIAWAVFIIYDVFLIRTTVGLLSPLYELLIYYSLNIGLFYFNAHVLLHYAFFRTRHPYPVAVLLIAAEILIYLQLKLFLDHGLKGTPYILFPDNLPEERIWLSNIWREVFFVGFSTAYWSMLSMLRFREQHNQAEREKLEATARALASENRYMIAENAYLQHQLSPHLLFNSLNFIYNDIRHLSQRAGRGILLLSDILRYSLVPNQGHQLVDLNDEIEHIDKLIALIRLRFRETLYLEFTLEGPVEGVRIPPLILLTLVENIMKHGDLGDPEHPASISMSVSGLLLRFKTFNLKRNPLTPLRGGIGLQNMTKRLENFYASRYKLDVSDDIETFTAILTIQL